MIINIDYGEDYDVLYILDENADPNELHHQFLEWLYDKNTEHNYFITLEDGSKMYNYDASAFVEWLNDNMYKDSEKARIVKKYADTIDENFPIIVF